MADGRDSGGARRSRRASATEPFVRVGPLLAVPEVLRELGHDPGRVLAAVGLGPADFVNPDQRIPFAMAAEMLAECARVTARPHFGLLVGSRLRLANFGPLESVLLCAPSVREALLGFVRNISFQDRGGVPFLHQPTPSLAGLGYSVYVPTLSDLAPAYDVCMAIGMVMLRTLCGRTWRPVKICFSHGPPRDLSPYRRCFGVPLEFDAPRSEILFAADWLDRSPPLAGQPLPPEVTNLVFGALDEQEFLADRVQRVVQGLALTGTVTSARVCSLVGLPGHTLRRRLRAEGFSLRRMINTQRLELARQLLAETHMPLQGIAQALGYADASAFTRAFRGWTGKAPSRWRR